MRLRNENEFNPKIQASETVRRLISSKSTSPSLSMCSRRTRIGRTWTNVCSPPYTKRTTGFCGELVFHAILLINLFSRLWPTRRPSSASRLLRRKFASTDELNFQVAPSDKTCV